MGLLDGFRSKSAAVAVLPPPPVSVPLPPPPSYGSSVAVIDEGKAAYGTGVGMVLNNPMLSTISRSPQQFMREAQMLSHSNPWISTAERAVLGAFIRTPWHLEDANEEEVTTGAAWDLVSRPNGGDPRLLGRRELWRITLRHIGVCANSYWYLDQTEALGGTPLRTLYINPARMYPAEDKQGNLVGWLLDADGRGHGTPLPMENVVHFRLEAPDWGNLGTGGYVESALTKAELSRQTDRYAMSLMAGAGIRGGIIAPREGRMPDDVFDAAVAAFKTISDDPWAARRNIILKGAVDYTPRSQTAQELGLQDLMTLGRDDIFAIWGVPPESRGIPAPAGLNSGAARSNDDAVLWQSGVEDRATAFVETFQTVVLDRFSKLGQPTTLVIEAPTFDDDGPAYELASKSVVIAMSHDERRDIVGLAPLDPAVYGDLGKEVYVASSLSRVDEIEEPKTAAVSVVPPVPPQLLEAENPVEGKAKGEKGIPAWRDDLEDFLRDQRDEIVRLVSEKAAHLMRRPGDIDAWWNQSKWDRALAAVNGPRLASTAAVAVVKVEKGSGKAGPDDGWQRRVGDFVAQRGGERIRSINGTTRDGVLAVIRRLTGEASEAGWSPAQLASRLTDEVGDLGVWSPSRAEMIARTETMLAYNDAALQSFGEFGVTHVEAIDGDDDPECAERNGQTYPIDEALTIIDHPNGTLDWIPVT